jgi:hypothetical protein
MRICSPSSGEHLGGLEVQPRCGRQGVTGRFGGGHVLGATVVASRAGEMIGELALAMAGGGSQPGAAPGCSPTGSFPLFA